MLNHTSITSLPACNASSAHTDTVCVATVVTGSRIANLHRLAASWPGALSIAYLSDALEHDFARHLALLALPDGSLPAAPERLTLSLVENRRFFSPLDRFPTNMLRNVAVNGCAANMDMVLVVDADFELCCGPPTALAARLEAHAARIRVAYERDKREVGIVLPAFGHTAASCDGLATPPSKVALVERLRRGELESFQVGTSPESHACDNIEQWAALSPATAAADVARPSSFPTQLSFGCEPYVLHSRWRAPAYDASFVGYGKNRIAFHYEHAARGVELHVEPEMCLVHSRHNHTRQGAQLPPSPQPRLATPTPPLANASASTTNFNAPPAEVPGWTVGESCWQAFVARVAAEYGGFMMTPSPEQHNRTRYCGFNNPFLRALPGGWPGVVCVSVQENLCASRYCRPAVRRICDHGGEAQRFPPLPEELADPHPHPARGLSKAERRARGRERARAVVAGSKLVSFNATTMRNAPAHELDARLGLRESLTPIDSLGIMAIADGRTYNTSSKRAQLALAMSADLAAAAVRVDVLVLTALQECPTPKHVPPVHVTHATENYLRAKQPGWWCMQRAHLGGVAQLLERMPNATWYLLLDEDTLVFSEVRRAEHTAVCSNGLRTRTMFISCDAWTVRACLVHMHVHVHVCMHMHMSMYMFMCMRCTCAQDGGAVLTPLSSRSHPRAIGRD